MTINLKIEIFQEENLYVALSPELNVSSYGDTIEEAERSLEEALTSFFEACEEMGTLEEVLEESGFKRTGKAWRSRKPVKEESLAVAI